MTSTQRLTDKRITRAIMEYDLLEDGDRVLVAISGGKDSLALAWNLAQKVRGYAVSFEVEALHLTTGFADPDHPRILGEQLAGWGLKLRVVGHPAAEEAATGRPPSCFACARDRRRILLEYASEHGFTKIALGHHMDDSLITLLMNMSWKGEMAAMPPHLRGNRPGSPSIIRPLILLQEEVITRLVDEEGWPVERCSCPWAGDSRRKDMTLRLEELTGGSAVRKLNLWKSLTNRKTDLLPPES